MTLLDVEQQRSLEGETRRGRVGSIRQRVAEAIREDTMLVSVMLANNEIGVIQPLAEIAAVCRHQGVLLHCDATQAVGKIPVNVRDLGIDLMSFSAHKIYGPKGIGALYVRQGSPMVRLTPQITGGGQQEGRRSGTLNVPGIVGFAKALELCEAEMAHEQTRLAELRNRLFEGLNSNCLMLELCGPDWRPAENHHLRLPGNLNVAFGDVDGEALLLEMGNLAVSSGATCSAHEPGPSHVLHGLGAKRGLGTQQPAIWAGSIQHHGRSRRRGGNCLAAVKKLRKLG